MNLELYVRCFDSLVGRGLSRGPNNLYVYMNHSDALLWFILIANARLVAICWERTVPLAFHLCCFYFSAVLIAGPFPVWCSEQDMEFDCIGC